MIGSVTVLPAVLELLGDRIDRGRIPWLPHLQTETADSRFWPAVIDRVLRRPALSCAPPWPCWSRSRCPALSHARREAGRRGARVAETSRRSQTLARVRATFPSTASPAMVVVVGPPAQRAKVLAAIGRAGAAGRGTRHRPSAVPPERRQRRGLGLASSCRSTGAGDNDASRHAIAVLRDELIPLTLGRMPGVETAVTGDTAEDVDFTRQMKHGMPYVIAFVLLFAFVLLLAAFRSIVVPLKAIVLNLLSVGAAYGVLVLVFQHSWAEGILGFRSNGSIVSWLPLFLFVVLFGLSMDYHVFILSRVREGVDGGMRVGRGGALRHHGDGGRGDERGARHGRRVLDLRHAQRARREAGGRRPGGRGADRRDDRPRRAAALVDAPAGRLELVPAEGVRALRARRPATRTG